MSNKKKLRLSRRELLRIAAAGAGAAAIGWVPEIAKAQSGGSNPTATENQKTGTTAWQLANPATNRQIEGYASLTSVNRGGSIQFFVNTKASSYSINVYRMGWYGGTGGRLVAGPINVAGTSQVTPTADPTTGLIECRW